LIPAASTLFEIAPGHATSKPMIMAFVEAAFAMSASVIGPTPVSIIYI
jgi:hypothetical protein